VVRRMKYRRIATSVVLLNSISLGGCVRRDGRNSDCKWPGEPNATRLHPDQQRNTGHLRKDVEFAEELAVEYMDAHYGPRSGNFQSQHVADQALNTCLGTLIEQIANSHDVPSGEATNFVGRRSLAIDVAVSTPFVLLYGLLARMLIDKLRRRYRPENGWMVALAMIIFASLVLGVGGTMLGQQWSILAENVRVGNGHLSYRVDRYLGYVTKSISSFSVS
jgi:hypothetical protein